MVLRWQELKYLGEYYLHMVEVVGVSLEVV